jgi:hypothetical protein
MNRVEQLPFAAELPVVLLFQPDEDRSLVLRMAFAIVAKAEAQTMREGKQALAYLRADPPYSDRARFRVPKLLVCDFAAPPHKAEALLAWMQLRNELRGVVRVVINSDRSAGSSQQAEELGAHYYDIPESFDELKVIVRTIAGLAGIPLRS